VVSALAQGERRLEDPAMSLSWYRNYFTAPGKARPLKRPRLELEMLENRLVPSSTYQWTGAGATTNWDDAGNWTPAAGATGTYPGSGGATDDSAQFVDAVPGGIKMTTAVVDAAFTLAEIDFNSALNVVIASDGNLGHTLTIANTIAAANPFTAGAIRDRIDAPVVAGAGLQVTNTSGPTSAQISITGGVALGTGTLTLAGNIAISGTISGAGGLSVAGTRAVTLSGANSYTGPTSIAAGATVNALSGTALGSGDVTLQAGAILNVSAGSTVDLGQGLPGRFYSIAGDTLPDSRMTTLAGINAMIAQYGGGTTANPFGSPIATDTSGFTTSNTRGQTNTNSNGATFNYGTGSTTAQITAGFPTVVKTTNSGGSSILGVWTGIFFAAVTGTYEFDTASDDGSTLILDGSLVVNNNFAQTITTRTGAVNLTAGPHQIEIAYYNGGGGYGLWADVQLPGSTTFQRLPNALLGTVAPTLLQLGSLSGSGTVNLGSAFGGFNGGLSVGANNHSTMFSGTINAPAANVGGFPNLVKAGTGAFILPLGESYTGQTAISSGVLQFGTGTGAISSLPTSSILDNGTLTVFLPSNSNLIYNGVISGSGGLSLEGTSDVLTLGGMNTYSGSTFVGGNTIKQGVTDALAPSSVYGLGNPAHGGTIDLNGFDAVLASFTALNPGSLLTNSSPKTATLTLNGSGTLVNFNVAITGNLNLAITSGSFRFASPSWNGSTTISGGELTGALPMGTALTVSGAGVFDMIGVNDQIASLSGNGTGNAIVNSSTNPAVLTISGTAAGSYAYTGAITGPISIVNSTGSSTLTALTNGTSNTFSGGVLAKSGTLAGVPGAFGSGPITLGGGSVDLQAGQAVVGFGGNGRGWTINTVPGTTPAGGTGTLTNGGTGLPIYNTFELTSNNPNQGSNLFYNTPVQPDGGFTASFTYLDNTPASSNPGEGFALIFQADPKGPSVIGGAGVDFAYGPGGNGSNGVGGISNSVALVVSLSTSAPGGQSIGIWSGGNVPSKVNPLTSALTAMLVSGDPIDVVVTYNASGQALVANFTDSVTGTNQFVDFFAVNLSSFLPTNVFVGLSGSTGSPQQAQQFVSNFSYLGASGAATALANNLGGNGSLTLQANTLANAYSTSGNLTVSGGALTIATDATSTPNQAYSLAIGGTTTLAGNLNVMNNGMGTGGLLLNGPVQGVGTSIGAIGGGGNVVLGASSTYQLVLGGSTQPGSYSDLMVSGALNLAGGNLAISYANSFAPTLGQSFTILESTGPLSGTFAQGGTLSAGSATYAITYNANSVVLTVTSIVTPMQLTISNVPLMATAGVPFSVTIAATDGSGNIAGGDNDVVTLSTNASGGTISPTQVTLTNGSATVPITLSLASIQAITAIDVTTPSLTPGMASLTVGPGPFSQYKVTTLGGGGGATAGNGFLIEVQATDSNGNVVSSYGGPTSVTVSASPTDPLSTNLPQSVPLDSTGRGFALGTLDTAGTYQLIATGGAYTTPTPAALTVLPANPSRLGFVAQPANTPTGLKLPPVTVAIEDPFGNVITSDNTDQVVLSIGSGPGPGAPGFLAGSTLTATAVNGIATFDSLALVIPGNYTLIAIVPARYTGPASQSFFIAPLQVVPGSLVGSPSGFTVSFNAPFLVNSTTPVLYGTGFGPTAPVPTVTLTGPSGPVEGSVVMNTAANSLTFLETDTANVYGNGLPPQLPDGIYTVVIHGTAAGDGLLALNAGGGYLDGTFSGTPDHDYSATFNVAVGSAGVLWIPATADGPKQPLEAPGNNIIGGGYPVYLDDLTGQVTSVNVTFNYNPAMLMVTGVSSNPDLPGSSFTLNSALSSPGQAVLTYSGNAADAANLTGGNVPLGFINATVPNSSATVPIYKGKDLLTLSNLSVNGGGIAAVGVNALHLVAFAGDADGSGSYSSADAVAITRAGLQVDSGFVAYPLVDPVIVADTDGSGFIPADAALQANEVGVGFPANNIPPLPPPPLSVLPISNNVDPTLSLAAVSTASAVSVSVNLDDAHPAGSTGLVRATLALRYDPAQFAVSAADIRAGSLLRGGAWTVQPIIDAATAQIVILLSSDTPIISTQSGSLVTIDFQSLRAIVNPSSIALVASADPNGQPFATELDDLVGAFTISWSP
jgi:autotransporter-associated beta strand protein